MFLNSIALISQEVLEASILISILMALAKQLQLSQRWVLIALVMGSIFAFIYGQNMGDVSEWFDYVGQEIVNASIQLLIVILMFLATFLYSHSIFSSNKQGQIIFLANAIAIVALAIVREGAEIYNYLIGALVQPDYVLTVTAGSLIGTGIGISIGVLFYYAMGALTGKKRHIIGLVLFSLIAGSMTSQAILLLNQADWLISTPVLWDSSHLLSEHSLTGRLLYGLIGYEATPSALEFAGYLGTALIILFIGMKKMPKIKCLEQTINA
ncbi:MAG: iron permease [Gammaproteobacteria bacterium]|nr:FTR1 family protein [Gammaproteobacteria bacterium]PCH62163.1 MAG: iron permease [Gammaproteobacteria bacterium]